MSETARQPHTEEHWGEWFVLQATAPDPHASATEIPIPGAARDIPSEEWADFSKPFVSVNPPDLSKADAWRDKADCQNMDQYYFFAEGPTAGASNARAFGKAVCGRCEVKTECLQSSLDHKDEFGIWGGLDHDDRKRLIRKTNRQPIRASQRAS